MKALSHNGAETPPHANAGYLARTCVEIRFTGERVKSFAAGCETLASSARIDVAQSLDRRTLLQSTALVAAHASCSRVLTDQHTLTVLVQSEPVHLDPRFPTDSLSANIARLVYNSLFDVDPTTLHYRASLAESVTWVSPLVAHVKLRSGQRFHDHAELTAADVVATYEGTLSAELGSPNRSLAARVLHAVRAVDGLTVEFVLRERTILLQLLLTLPIVRAQDARAREVSAEPGNERRFVGTGQLRVRSLQRNAWEFAALMPAPNTPRSVRFLTVKDSNTLALRLLHGRADVAEVKPELFPLFIGRPGFTVARAPGVATVYLPIRNDHAWLRKPELRRAIALAIDRVGLVRGKMGGFARVADGIFPPSHWAFEPASAPSAYDPARARALVDLHWPAAQRQPLILRCSNQRFVMSNAVAITEMLRTVGIAVELRPSELAVLLADLQAGRFDLAMMQAPDVSDPYILWSLFATAAQPTARDPRAGRNRWRYSNAQFDQHVETATRSFDVPTQLAHYRHAQRILSEDLPVIPLWHPDVVFVGAPRVKGLRVRGDARFDSLLDVSLDLQH